VRDDFFELRIRKNACKNLGLSVHAENFTVDFMNMLSSTIRCKRELSLLLYWLTVCEAALRENAFDMCAQKAASDRVYTQNSQMLLKC